MKGYGIYVKNDLLEPKHAKIMGTALWEYLWLLDKITSIDESGVGKILGGKPIKRNDISKDLGISERHISIHLKTLEKNGYINILRTPYGFVITINKSSKIFGNKEKLQKVTSQTKREVTKSVKRSYKSGNPLTKKVTSNKTIQLDNTKTIQVAKATKQSFGNEDINAILDVFKGLPLTQIKRQRQSAYNLVRRHGIDKALKLARYSQEIQSDKYSPTTHDVISLWDNQTKLVAYWNKHSNQVIDIGA